VTAWDTGYSTGFGPLPAPPPPPPNGSSPLTSLRLAVAAALGTIPDVIAADWTVIDAPTDAVTPPCYLLDWGPDPWRVELTFCQDAANLEVLVIVDRLTPEANYPTLEAMVDAACNALSVAGMRSPQSLAPAPTELGNVTYLGARVQVRQPVEVTT